MAGEPDMVVDNDALVKQVIQDLRSQREDDHEEEVEIETQKSAVPLLRVPAPRGKNWPGQFEISKLGRRAAACTLVLYVSDYHRQRRGSCQEAT